MSEAFRKRKHERSWLPAFWPGNKSLKQDGRKKAFAKDQHTELSSNSPTKTIQASFTSLETPAASRLQIFHHFSGSAILDGFEKLHIPCLPTPVALRLQHSSAISNPNDAKTIVTIVKSITSRVFPRHRLLANK